MGIYIRINNKIIEKQRQKYLYGTHFVTYKQNKLLVNNDQYITMSEIGEEFDTPVIFCSFLNGYIWLIFRTKSNVVILKYLMASYDFEHRVSLEYSNDILRAV